MSQTIIVTGGTGYIAGFVIRQLVAEGWHVRTTIRNLSREDEMRGWLDVDNSRLRVFAANLTSDDGWAEACAGCTHMAHLASPLPTQAVRDPDTLIVPARDGALRALRFARGAGVGRVVMTSSVAAVAYGHDPARTRFTEDDWSNAASDDTFAYAKSKTIAERAARDWMASHGGAMEYVSVNPSLVLGPLLAPDFSASLEVAKKLVDGSMPGLPNLGFSVVDVRDVAALHVRCLTEPGLNGERFIAAGPFLMMHEVAAIARAALIADGQHAVAARIPSRRLPDWLVRLAARFDPMLRQVTGELGKVRDTSADHARTRLGWQTRDVRDSIGDAVRDMVRLGVVKG